MEKCYCCNGNDFDGQVCSYCGFRQPIELDSRGREHNIENAKSHKEKTINNITDISVVAFKYDFDDETGVTYQGENKIKIADGPECFNKMFFFGNQFEQNPDKSNPERELNLVYKFKGIEKTLSLSCRLPQTEDLWDIGVIIDDDLMLGVAIGSVSDNTKISGISLDLKD